MRTHRIKRTIVDFYYVDAENDEEALIRTG